MNICALYGSIGECRLLTAIFINNFVSAIRELNFFTSIREMRFYLSVSKPERFESMLEGGLGSVSLSEEVDHFLIVRERLLDVLVTEVHNGVAIRKYFLLDSIVELNHPLSVLKLCDDFTIVTDSLFDDSAVGQIVIVILLRECQSVLIFNLWNFCHTRRRLLNNSWLFRWRLLFHTLSSISWF